MNEAPLNDGERARLRAAFAEVNFARLLGIELISAERGAATLRMDVRPELTRNGGLLHGGAVASLIDTASAFAVMSLLEAGEQTVTVDLTLHFLRPATGGALTARARVLRAGRRLVTVAVDVTDDASGALGATALTTYARRKG